MLSSIYLMLKSVKFSTIIPAILVLVSFSLGMYLGIQGGKYTERSKNAENTRILVQEHNATIAVLTKNANDWKASLENAQARAIQSANLQSKQLDAINTVTNRLKQQNITTIIRELRNDCKATDIIVNTDNADRLRNCFAKESPSTCAGNN